MKENKKILIHGAVDSSNFGDVLFVHIFYENLKTIDNLEVNFLGEGKYSISEFNRKELNYKKKITWNEAIKHDVLIYMSGGYFGDDDKSFKKSIKRYVRYFRLGLKFANRNKPIFIIGVGGAPLYGKICSYAVKKIIKKSNYISVRDKYTMDFFSQYIKLEKINLTADTALSIRKKDIPDLNNDIKKQINTKLEDKKIILMHLPGTRTGDEEVLKKIIPSLNRFLNNNKDFGVIVCNDFLNIEDISKNICYNEIETQYKYAYNYYSAYQLCSLINYSDYIITAKLHVGIIGSSFGKSVLSIPLHSSKTTRFYEQIGESDRCVHMNDITPEMLDIMFEKYKNKRIKISKEIIKQAKENVEILKTIDEYL